MPPATPRRPRIIWRYGLLACAGLLLLSIYPQLALWAATGGGWNGSPAHAHGDEIVYAAYLNALVEGRPRRNDPYTRRDELLDSRRQESYFSIQFVPPYLVALPARLFRAQTSHALMALPPLAALACGLALFWLAASITGDSRFAACAALVTLCFGSTYLLAHYALGQGPSNNHLPFLRRYLPSVPLPLLFVFIALVLRSLAAEERAKSLLNSSLAGLAFAALVFSYFYLWTTAAAWLLCLALLRLALTRLAPTRPALDGPAAPHPHSDPHHPAAPLQRRGRADLLTFGVIGLFAAVSLAPYFLLVSRRAASTDAALLLTHTRAPDLLRWPELAGVVALSVLISLWRRRLVDANDGAVVFAASLALTPLVVFNQQVLTGRSLQPFHYTMFVVNYVAVLSLLLAGFIAWRATPRVRLLSARVLLVCLTAAALASGAAEAVLASRNYRQANLLRDSARSVARALAQLAARHDDQNAAHGAGRSASDSPVVFATDYTVADTLPAVAPQPVLWSPHLFNFGGAALEEDRSRLMLYLYFTGADFRGLEPSGFAALGGRARYLISALVGRGRHNPNLSADWTPITDEEVAAALRDYGRFIETFDARRAAELPVAFLVTSRRERVDLSNFDRWYVRDGGEQFGDFTLYRVTPREGAR